VSANAWHGTAAGLGWIAGIAVILLLIWEGARLAGAEIDVGADRRAVTTILTGAVLIGAVVKWILVLGKYPGPGAWIGLVLVICLAGYVALQPRAG
jgi:predicted permease